MRIPTRITFVDDEHSGIGSAWDIYKDKSGALRGRYTMLTANADTHLLQRNDHWIKNRKTHAGLAEARAVG